jgi:antitoxin VapB
VSGVNTRQHWHAYVGGNGFAQNFSHLLLSLPAMALQIPHPEANRLAEEVAALAGENTTEAMILTLRERLQRLRQQRQSTSDAKDLLVHQLDHIPQRCALRSILDPRGDDEILGFDQTGLPS